MKNWIDSLKENTISCIIPTYNRPKFLEQSLLSIYTQQPDNKDFLLEVIVVDDGSSDFEARMNFEICESYKSLGIDVKYIKLEENSGTVSIPRNIGISHISGKTIAPVDDDCFCTDYKFDTLFGALNDNHKTYTPLAFGNRRECIYHKGLIEEIRTVQSKNQRPEEVGLDNGQFIYSASIYEFIDPVFAINACDWELYKQIAKIGNFVFVDEIVCNYIWHGKNSSLISKPLRVNPESILCKFLKYFKDNEFTNKIKTNLV